jgi:hypothetical protein
VRAWNVTLAAIAVVGVILMAWAGALLTFAGEYRCQSGMACTEGTAQVFRALGVWLLLSTPLLALGVWRRLQERSRLPGGIGAVVAFLAILVHAMSLWQAQELPMRLSFFGWCIYTLAMLLLGPPAPGAPAWDRSTTTAFVSGAIGRPCPAVGCGARLRPGGTAPLARPASGPAQGGSGGARFVPA